ncbi:MAG: AbrB/MazE/SpoVT family DNA-binding domain-containing protein [Candidatus Aminicenantes bacterium]|nr:AbrB/MazE/SpoVT family DNA-binding domain-containing protein [Candidatus Aminicenantes bacterium]
MLCKRTYKNQVTIPKKVMEKFADVEYFEATAEEGKITLTPVEISLRGKANLDKIRKKMSALGVTPQDVDDAIAWARKK